MVKNSNDPVAPDLEHSPFPADICPCRVFTDHEEQTAWHAGFEARLPAPLDVEAFIGKIIDAVDHQVATRSGVSLSNPISHARRAIIEQFAAEYARLSDVDTPPAADEDEDWHHHVAPVPENWR